VACLAMHCATASKLLVDERGEWLMADGRRETMKGRASIHEAGPSAELPRYEDTYLPPSLPPSPPALLPAPILHILRAQFAFLSTTSIDSALPMWANRPGSNAIPTGTPCSPELRARCRSGRMKKAQDCHQCTGQPCRNSHQNSIQACLRMRDTMNGRKVEGDANSTTSHPHRTARQRNPAQGGRRRSMPHAPWPWTMQQVFRPYSTGNGGRWVVVGGGL
jgi:hypothetical protein